MTKRTFLGAPIIASEGEPFGARTISSRPPHVWRAAVIPLGKKVAVHSSAFPRPEICTIANARRLGTSQARALGRLGPTVEHAITPTRAIISPWALAMIPAPLAAFRANVPN